jgi:hypothetical protein
MPVWDSILAILRVDWFEGGSGEGGRGMVLKFMAEDT